MFVYSIVALCLMLSKTAIQEAISSVTVLDKGIFPIEKGSIGILFYVDIENNHRWNTCRVRSWAKMCCLEDEPYKDCCRDIIYGDNIDALMPNRRETLIYVFPTLYQHDQAGFCDFVIQYRCGKQKRSIREDVNIPFNTKLSEKKIPGYLKIYKDQKKAECKSLDEDTLNECSPVLCDLKYSGRRPYYDARHSKCVSVPICKTNLHKELPDIVYVPKSNICRDLDQPMTLGDIYAISTGLGVVTEPKQIIKPDELKVQVYSNCSTISQNLVLLKDLMTGKLCPLFQGDTTPYSDCCKNAMLSICAWIIAICAVLISVICCINTAIWFLRKASKGELDDFLRNCKSKITKDNKVYQKPSRVCRDVTNNLLKEVIVRDLPIELRDSVEDICDRIGKEVARKRRYRLIDLGSQINLLDAGDSSSSSAKSVRDDDD